MPRRKKLSQEKLENRHEIIRKFREANECKAATAIEIAQWAIDNKLWKPQPVEVRMQLAEQISQAMREEYITDPQGRRVRAKHAAHIKVDGEQMVFWADIRDQRPETHHHMEIAFQNRRQQIVGDCKQLKTDIDSYNQNWNSGEMIQSCFDFTDDLAELELAALHKSCTRTKPAQKVPELHKKSYQRGCSAETLNRVSVLNSASVGSSVPVNQRLKSLSRSAPCFSETSRASSLDNSLNTGAE